MDYPQQTVFPTKSKAAFLYWVREDQGILILPCLLSTYVPWYGKAAEPLSKCLLPQLNPSYNTAVLCGQSGNGAKKLCSWLLLHRPPRWVWDQARLAAPRDPWWHTTDRGPFKSDSVVPKGSGCEEGLHTLRPVLLPSAHRPCAVGHLLCFSLHPWTALKKFSSAW